MGIKTKIEWTDSSCNPIVGCTGCELRKDHCCAAALCARYAGRKGWPQSFDHPEFFPGRLEKAIRWKDLMDTKRLDKPWLDGYPRVIFVNDLSDGFCPDVDPGVWLSPLLGQMAASPHIWMLLTKWPDRMAGFFAQHSAPDNFWLGTSITNQKDADERIPWLLQIQAAVHFVSLEPLLELVDIKHYLDGMPEPEGGGHCGYVPHDMAMDAQDMDLEGESLGWQEPTWVQTVPPLSGVIVGGETGHGARPMPLDGLRSLRDQCQAADIPFFFKHWGEWLDVSVLIEMGCDPYSSRFPEKGHYIRVGKKRAGRLLDGRTWDEMPRRQR